MGCQVQWCCELSMQKHAWFFFVFASNNMPKPKSTSPSPAAEIISKCFSSTWIPKKNTPGATRPLNDQDIALIVLLLLSLRYENKLDYHPYPKSTYFCKINSTTRSYLHRVESCRIRVIWWASWIEFTVIWLYWLMTMFSTETGNQLDLRHVKTVGVKSESEWVKLMPAWA